MAYLIRETTKEEHTAYYEFQKGKWDGESFWKSAENSGIGLKKKLPLLGLQISDCTGGVLL
jgi:hypothetical protein